MFMALTRNLASERHSWPPGAPRPRPLVFLYKRKLKDPDRKVKNSEP